MKKDRKPAESKPVKEGEVDATFEALERVFHERARLSILTRLLPHLDGVPFTELKESCQLTDGNLSRHLQALREAGIVELWRRTSSGRPQTICVLTDEGRARFVGYLDALESVVRTALDGLRESRDARRAPRSGPRFRPGLA